jgi:hypothetical protein
MPMRKRIIAPPNADAAAGDPAWLDLESLAEVEVTSEDPAHPIEAALLAGKDGGWRAAGPGGQTVRLIFGAPQRIARIALRFEEHREDRTQEYLLRWSPDGGKSYHELVRQEWNFSPHGSTTQVEDHRVELPAVTVLELNIVPNKGGGSARASLQRLQLA